MKSKLPIPVEASIFCKLRRIGCLLFGCKVATTMDDVLPKFSQTCRRCSSVSGWTFQNGEWQFQGSGYLGH